MTTQFRYSKNSFSRSVWAALGLTLIVSFLVWLFSRLLGLRHADLITLVSGVIFFGFCSAAMIWHYLRRAVVVAVRPDGLFDARYSAQSIPWDEIKDVRLARVENDFQMEIFLWPNFRKNKQAGSGGAAEFSIDLSSLDASPEQVLQAMGEYKQISIEQVAGEQFTGGKG